MSLHPVKVKTYLFLEETPRVIPEPEFFSINCKGVKTNSILWHYMLDVMFILDNLLSGEIRLSDDIILKKSNHRLKFLFKYRLVIFFVEKTYTALIQCYFD